MTESAIALRVGEETPAYWRVVFDYPPFKSWTRLSSKASRIARANGRQAKPPCRCIRKRES